MSESVSSTRAHRVSLAVSVAVLVALAAVLLTGLGDHAPARPVAVVESIGPVVDGVSQVPVEVTNEGDRAADGVQISATLVLDGEEQTGDQTIDFLGAGEQRRVVFVFEGDPTAGELTVVVTGFTEP